MEGEAEILDVGGLDTSTDVVETDVTTDPVIEAPETPEGEAPETKPEEKLGDGRALPKDIQRGIKALKDNPELAPVARALNDAYWREQAYTKSFAKPADAQAAKATLELVGGPEGIEQLQESIRSMELVDKDIAEGNPGFLDDIIKTSPEGFKKLVGPILSKLYTLDTAAYGNVVAPVIHNTLRAYQLPQVIQALENVQDVNAKAALAQLKQLQSDLDDTVKNLPKQQPEGDDRKKAADAEWEKIHGEKTGSALSEVTNDVMKSHKALLDKSLNPLLKQRALPEQAKQDTIEGINGEVAKLLEQDKDYMRYVEAAKGKIARGIKNGEDVAGLKKSLGQYLKAKLEETVPKAVRSVWNRRGYSTTVAPRKAAPPAPAATNRTPQKKDYWQMNESEREAWRAQRAR